MDFVGTRISTFETCANLGGFDSYGASAWFDSKLREDLKLR